MSFITFHVTIELKPAVVEEVTQYLIDYADKARKEEGNIRFDVYIAENTLHLEEVYTSEAAVKTHTSMPYYGQLMSYLEDKMTGNGATITELKPVHTTVLN